MQRLLDDARRTSAPLPDAVFAFNDAAALAAMRVCQAFGLRVPQDVAIVGFDDIPGASHAAPALSTIAVDKEALGRRGVELLLEETPQTSEIVLPVKLIERASTVALASDRTPAAVSAALRAEPQTSEVLQKPRQA